MVETVIIPNVEFSTQDIPSKAFLRKTKKISLKVSDEGFTFTGVSIHWDEIKDVRVKFFNSNPYIQLMTSSDTVYSLFFENKFYYRRRAPWFGASEYITTEFVKILEEKNLFTVDKLISNVQTNRQGKLIHSVWNSLFLLIPVVLIFTSVFILYAGWTFGSQIQLI